jgi:HKD family nuclease
VKAGTAKIIGLTEDFDLLDELRAAKAVTLVMAFAKKSGWESIKEAILLGDTQVEVLVGLNFEITDPGVLTEWLRLKEKDPYRFTIDVAPRNPVFHPKVILVERADNSRFAIVGSGNLTGGGLSRNVECGVLLEDQGHLDELALWNCRLARESLSLKIIEEYRSLYKEFIQANWRRRKSASKLNQLLRGARSAEGSNLIPTWDVPNFLRDMERCLESEEGISGLKNREEGTQLIRRLLDMPHFNFNEKAFEEFYGVAEFGRMRQAYKKPLLSQIPQLRRSLRLLTEQDLSEETLEKIL